MFLNFLPCPVIGHTGPVGSPSKEAADVTEGELAEDPQGENFFVRFLHLMQNPMNGQGQLLVRNALFDGFPRVGNLDFVDILGMLCLSQMG